ncbi:hypothetical protein BJX70DRAFT_42668 [Aspergillus crustosus]
MKSTTLSPYFYNTPKMPCENLSQLCPTCLDLASKCSTKLSAEYIPVNSLHQPAGTKPLALEFDTATAFDPYKGGKLIGENLRDLMEPYLTTQGAASVRRFHMWIRHYTEAEKTAPRGQLAPGTDAVPVVKVSVLIKLPMLTARKDARNLADVVKGMAATMTGQSPGALAGLTRRRTIVRCTASGGFMSWCAASPARRTWSGVILRRCH